jgi:predicted secreted protein
MRRLAALLVVIATILAGGRPAAAGDTATLEILGFSKDGGVFAFEEYGRQDGSGFPFANRFYIDVARDRFLPNTPIRVRIDDESATIEAARTKARQQGQGIVADAVLAANRGFTAGSNSVTELSADPHRMQVNPRPVFPPVDAPIEFRLEEDFVSQEAAAAIGCEDFGEIKGFRLMSVAMEPGAAVRTLHADTTIPRSRACPLGYSIGAVQTFYPADGEPVLAVLIAIRSVGFEGPSFRWIAVTGQLGN